MRKIITVLIILILIALTAVWGNTVCADESETIPETESRTKYGMEADKNEQTVQMELEQRYNAEAGKVLIDEELSETHMGDIGRSLAEREGELSEFQCSILDACAVTPPTGPHLCATWISNVFDRIGMYGVGGNANDMWADICYSSDFSELEPGMLIATQHSRTDEDSDGYIYGHVGIYIGGGYVIQSATVDDEGKKIITSLDDWLQRYDPFDTVKWGFPND